MFAISSYGKNISLLHNLKDDDSETWCATFDPQVPASVCSSLTFDFCTALPHDVDSRFFSGIILGSQYHKTRKV